MQVHLVDATYELFRAHFSPRPPVLGRDGIVLSGVSGLVEQLCHLVREQGATHIGCATDRVVRSFRNDLYPGYKSEEGMDACGPRPVSNRRGGHRGPRASSCGRWWSSRPTMRSRRRPSGSRPTVAWTAS